MFPWGCDKSIQRGVTEAFSHPQWPVTLLSGFPASTLSFRYLTRESIRPGCFLIVCLLLCFALLRFLLDIRNKRERKTPVIFQLLDGQLSGLETNFSCIMHNIYVSLPLKYLPVKWTCTLSYCERPHTSSIFVKNMREQFIQTWLYNSDSLLLILMLITIITPSCTHLSTCKNTYRSWN